MHMRETVGCDIWKRYAKSCSMNPHLRRQRTRKNSFFPDSAFARKHLSLYKVYHVMKCMYVGKEV